MKIAVAGCAHGKLTLIYKTIQEIEKNDKIKVNLLLICGDFQSIRNENDLKCIAVPDKYKDLGDFHEYFNGKKKPYVLTLFIGGNHEASNYLQTLPYGGWVAKDIYYLGYASIVNFNGIRIAGLSGIYYRNDKDLGHYENLPFDRKSLRSVYHTRCLEYIRMMQINKKLDIMITHDWPLHIYNHGNINYLLNKKPFFRQDIQEHKLGNPMYENLLYKLKPSFWFSAHLHVKFYANVRHDSKLKNYKKQDKIENIEEKAKSTYFLALDKCLPRKKYLEIIDIKSDENNTQGFEYDDEWLAILKLSNHLLSINNESNKSLDNFIIKKEDLEQEIDIINKKYNSLKIPDNFEINLPINENFQDTDPLRKNNYVNNQTTAFCNLFNVNDPIKLILQRINTHNPDKISISDDENSLDE